MSPKSVTAAAVRVEAFLLARAAMTGIDQEVIYSIGTGDGIVSLTASDLRLVGAAAGLYRTRVRELEDLRRFTRDYVINHPCDDDGDGACSTDAALGLIDASPLPGGEESRG